MDLGRSTHRLLTLRIRKWVVNIFIDGRLRYLGAYSSETQAARIYDREAVSISGLLQESTSQELPHDGRAHTGLLSKNTGSTIGRAYRVCSEVLAGFAEYAIDQYAVFSGQIDDELVMDLIEAIHIALLDMQAPMVSLHSAENSWFVGGRAEDEQIYHLYTAVGEITTDQAEGINDAQPTLHP